MDINELETYRLSDAIKYHDRLNPRLWGRDEHLLPEVRAKLLEIAQDFQEFLGINVDVADITISGSNAAYTYTDHSDIDLHLVVDLPRADSDEVYRELFDAKKYQYNDRNDFKIGGYDVELYVQDPSKPHHSQGIYSVKNNEWIDVPKRRKPDVDDVSVRSKYEDLGARIESAIESGDLDAMDAMAARIKELRAAGLADTGEFGPENLAFKILRNNGTLQRLSDARKTARDQRMSLSERKRKKSRKRKRYAYGGYWYPGYHYYGDTAAAADGDDGGGGESVRESREENQQSVVERFARSCSDFLGMEQCPRIKLRRDPEWSRVNQTFGRYCPDTRSIELSVAGRHIVDVLRTLAHEMTHARQDEVIGLPDDAGETGSQYEDQANAMAGQIMRHWAESEPELFQGVELAEDWRQTAGAAAAAACIAGAPGCATTGADALKTVQTVGRAAKNLPTRAGAEEELRQAVRDQLRRQRGEVVPEDYSPDDPPGPESKPTMPAGTVRVDVSDVYDWYKLGQHISNLKDLGRHDFGQGAPSAILSFGSEDQEHEYIQDLEKTGLTTTDIDPVDPKQPKNIKRQKVDPTYNVAEASGYIPTAAEKNDPRYSMALTQDVRPGETGRQANKLGLQTDAQGHPQLLMKKLNNLLESVKSGSQRQALDFDKLYGKVFKITDNAGDPDAQGFSIITPLNPGPWKTWKERPEFKNLVKQKLNDPGFLDDHKYNQIISVIQGEKFDPSKHITESEDQDLFEVRMSPGELQKWAGSEEARGIRAGFEAELIFRDTGREEEQESEPDYDADERARDIDDIIRFFQGGENGIGRNQANRLRNDLYEQFHEWISNTFYEDVWNERKYLEWVDDNIWPDVQDEWRERAQAELDLTDKEELTPEQTEEIEQTAQQMFREEAEEQWEAQSGWYSQAEEELLDEFRDENDESEWLDNNYPYMSDIESEFNLDWPYWTGSDERRGGSRDPGDIALSLSQELGVRAVASSNYHSTRRRPDLWIVEPDSSLDPDDSEDTGLEVVSPPMPLPVALQRLREIIDWANDSNEGNAYTNSSTGLHMGVSIPYKGGAVDYVKLVLFMGDQHVLDEFGRAANAYTASALEKLREVQRRRRENMSEADVRNMKGSDKTAAAMDLMRKNLIELAARFVQDGVGQGKYTSAHIKDGYIEFRSPGGDYLAMDERDEDALQNTMLRFARAMYLAGRPDLERKEYSKKLYKLLSGFRSAEISKKEDPRKPEERKSRVRYQTRIEYEDQNDAMELFARYVSGQITPDELKKQWAQQVLSQEMPKPAGEGEYEYEVVKDVSRHPDEPARRVVIDIIRANGDNEADRMVRDRYENEPDYYKYSAQRRRYQYDVINRDTGEVVGEIEDINLDRAIKQAWDQFGPGGENISFAVRDRPGNEKPQKPLSRRAEVARRIAEKPTLWMVKALDREMFVMSQNAEDAKRQARTKDSFFDRNSFYIDVRPATRAEWAEYRVQQADNKQDSKDVEQTVARDTGHYRVSWSETRDGRQIEDSLNIDAESAEAAAERVAYVLRVQGRVVRPGSVQATPVEPPAWRQPRSSELAQQAAELPRPNPEEPVVRAGEPGPGEFTGRWQIRNAQTGEVMHTIGGIGNQQVTANRYALNWLTDNGYGSGTEVDVVPEMR